MFCQYSIDSHQFYFKGAMLPGLYFPEQVWWGNLNSNTNVLKYNSGSYDFGTIICWFVMLNMLQIYTEPKVSSTKLLGHNIIKIGKTEVQV